MANVRNMKHQPTSTETNTVQGKMEMIIKTLLSTSKTHGHGCYKLQKKTAQTPSLIYQRHSCTGS